MNTISFSIILIMFLLIMSVLISMTNAMKMLTFLTV